MQFFIFLLLFYEIQGARIDYGKIKADNQEVACNFKDYNGLARDAFPKISAPHSRGCGGEMLSLRKIFSEIAETGSNLYGAVNVVDLLFSRTGVFDLNWNDPDEVNKILDQNICKNQFQELFVEFETSKSGHARIDKSGRALCIYSEIFAPESKSCPKAGRRKIKKHQAAVFALELEKITVVIQPGASFCMAHWSDMMEKSEQNQAGESENNPIEEQQQEDVEMEYEEEAEKPDSDEDETYQPDHSLDNEIDAEKIAAINKIGDFAGAEKIITKDSYVDLTDRAKRYKVVAGRTLLKFFAAVMAPDAEKEFGAKVCSIYQQEEEQSKPVNNILEAAAQQYQRATDKITKQIILGPLAATCSYREVYQHIPGLSYYLFNKARKCFNVEEIPENLEKTFYRYDPQKITSFVEFFTSPTCMVLLPYGQTSVKLSNGEKLDVAANMRMQSHKQIIRMFRKKMDEEGRSDEVLPLSTMYASAPHISLLLC